MGGGPPFWRGGPAGSSWKSRPFLRDAAGIESEPRHVGCYADEGTTGAGILVAACWKQGLWVLHGLGGRKTVFCNVNISTVVFAPYWVTLALMA